MRAGRQHTCASVQQRASANAAAVRRGARSLAHAHAPTNRERVADREPIVSTVRRVRRVEESASSREASDAHSSSERRADGEHGVGEHAVGAECAASEERRVASEKIRAKSREKTAGRTRPIAIGSLGRRLIGASAHAALALASSAASVGRSRSRRPTAPTQHSVLVARGAHTHSLTSAHLELSPRPISLALERSRHSSHSTQPPPSASARVLSTSARALCCSC